MRPFLSLPSRSPFSRSLASRSLATLGAPWLCALLLLSIAACGGGAPEGAFEASFPEPEQPQGGGNPGGGTTPPPAPQRPLWDADAAAYGRTALFGSFSSDLVRHGDTLFAVDADAIETNGARILAYDVSGSTPTVSSTFATTTIRGSDLIDSDGAAGDPASPVGFGFFVNDLLVVHDRLAFALVNAGGSDSVPALCNVVVFNPTSGSVLQTVDLGRPHLSTTPLFDSTGAPVAGSAFRQSGAEALAYASSSPFAGRLYVAMSNIVFGAPSYGATKLPGTVQVLEVATTSSAPLAFASLDGLTPFVIRTEGYNPVALETVRVPTSTGTALHRLLVTVAGTTGFDSAFNLVPVTPSSVEAYNASNGALNGVFQLGLSGLAAIRPAIGHDGAGHRVGFYPSSVTGEVFLLRLDGLYKEPVDSSQLAVLRGPLNGIPITAAQAGGPGGNITGIGLAPDGRTLAVTGFGDLFAVPQVPGQLFLLGLPTDLVTGSGFGANFTPGSTQFAATAGRTLGNVVLVPNAGARPDVYVNVSGTLDASFLGNGGASLGSLRTFGLMR